MAHFEGDGFCHGFRYRDLSLLHDRKPSVAGRLRGEAAAVAAAAAVAPAAAVAAAPAAAAKTRCRASSGAGSGELLAKAMARSTADLASASSPFSTLVETPSLSRRRRYSGR